MRLKDAIAFGQINSLSIALRGDEDMTEDTSRVVVSNTEGSRREDSHPVQAGCIPIDDFINIYIVCKFKNQIVPKHGSELSNQSLMSNLSLTLPIQLYFILSDLKNALTLFELFFERAKCRNIFSKL